MTPVYEYAWVHVVDVPARLAEGWEFRPTWTSNDPAYVHMRHVVAWSTARVEAAR